MRTCVIMTILLLALTCASDIWAGDFSALIVGVSKYPGGDRLTTTVADSRGLADVLMLCAGYDPTRVCRLTDDAKVHLSARNFDKAWADVKRCRELKAEIPDDLVENLKKASGRDE